MRRRTGIGFFAVVLAASIVSPAGAQVFCHTYDGEGRLRQSTREDGSQLEFVLDQNDNRTHLHRRTGATGCSSSSQPSGSGDGGAPGGVNSAPVAVDDSVSASTGQSITIYVLANDSDPQNDPLTVVSVTQPSEGSVTINSGGASVQFNAGSNAGTFIFNYTVSDGHGGSDVGQVSVAVSAPNGAPTANPDSYSSLSASFPTVMWLLQNDTDPDGDPLIITSVTQPYLGTVTIASDQKSVTFTPSGSGGIDGFTYTISDGRGGTAQGNVSFSVSGGGMLE